MPRHFDDLTPARRAKRDIYLTPFTARCSFYFFSASRTHLTSHHVHLDRSKLMFVCRDVRCRAFIIFDFLIADWWLTVHLVESNGLDTFIWYASVGNYHLTWPEGVSGEIIAPTGSRQNVGTHIAGRLIFLGLTICPSGISIPPPR